MPATPKDLQDEVIAVLNNEAGPHAQPNPKPGDSLELKFKLTSAQRKALAPDFEEIARTHKPDAEITMAQCDALKNAGEAVALVSKAAGFDGTWNAGGAA